jgi:hypothetical protein
MKPEVPTVFRRTRHWSLSGARLIKSLLSPAPSFDTNDVFVYITEQKHVIWGLHGDADSYRGLLVYKTA